jgi:hypothetical protein
MPTRQTVSETSNRFRALRLGLAAAAVTTGLVPSVASAATPRPGAACTKAKVGAQSGPLVCTKVGARYRWQPPNTPTQPPGQTPTASVAAAPPPSASGVRRPIGADALTSAFGGAVVVEANPTGSVQLSGDQLNSDGACHLEALLLPLVGCRGTVDFAGRPMRWQLVGYLASEYLADTNRRPAIATIGAEQSLYSPMSYGPDSAALYWFTQHGKQVQFLGTIRYFMLKVTTIDKAPIDGGPTTESILLRVGLILETRLAAANP